MIESKLRMITYAIMGCVYAMRHGGGTNGGRALQISIFATARTFALNGINS